MSLHITEKPSMPFLDRLQTLKASFSEPETDVIDAFLLIPFGQKQRRLEPVACKKRML